MTELREFKFVAKQVLVLKKIESEDKTKYDAFYLHSKEKAIVSKSDIDCI